MGKLQDVLNEREPKSLGKINGKDVYTFADEVLAGDKRNLDILLGGKMEFGERETREGGLSFTHSNIKSVAINPTRYYMNRYRTVTKDGAKVYQIVATMFGNDDYRVINEQSTGHVFTDSVVTRLFGQGDKKGTLKYIGTETVSADVFTKEFTHELNQEAMQKVYSCIATVDVTETTKDDLKF